MSGGGEVQAEIEFLDSVRALPRASSRKQRLSSKLGLSSGDRVLEVGPGTGEDLQRFAGATGPDGLAVGVDISVGLAIEAKRRAADRGVTIVVADARRLPFREGAFDAAYLERVLQHVPNVEKSVGELRRVLIAGGRVLVFEPDQALRAIDHPDSLTEELLRSRVSSAYANPTMGRRLFGLLVDEGFDVIEVEGTASAVENPSLGANARLAIEHAVRDGVIDRHVGEGYLTTLEDMSRRGAAFSVWIAFEVLAVKGEP